ncbi:MAG TPA: MATE family efflux transporter [Chloroflexia bacterium]|nr:MATE family efflux transporter [Chloroflexia bacterium]
MNRISTRRSPNGLTATTAPPEVDDREADQQAAEEAAGEVAEATDPLVAGGMSVETSAQAEAVAASEGSGEDGEEGPEGDLTPEARKEVSRKVFRLAWPAIAENALQTLLGIVDTAIVARLGTAALSGVGASQQLVWVLTTGLIAVSMGTTVLIARFTGAGQRERANAVLKQSLMMAVVLGLMLAPVGLLSHPLMTMLGLPRGAAEAGATYLSITLFFAVLIIVMFVAGAALRGAGDTKTPMYVTGFINIINAVLAVELVFGGVKASGILSGWLSGLASIVVPGTHIDIPGLSWVPEMGVAGSAWAAVVARGVGAAILVSFFLMPRSVLQFWRGGSWRPSWSISSRVLKVGLPAAMEQMLMSIGILVYSFIVIGMGEIIFATSRLALNAVFISQMPGFGFSMAATTLVGQSLGARQPGRARLGSQLATRSALIWMSIMGVAFFFFGEPILRIFTDDPQLLKLGNDAMKVIAFSQPPLALAFVLAGSLRGAGDVRFPMVVTTIAVWVVRLPIGAFLGLPTVCVPFTNTCMPGLGLGLPGIYAALIVEASFRAVLMFRRFASGKWESMKV